MSTQIKSKIPVLVRLLIASFLLSFLPCWSLFGWEQRVSEQEIDIHRALLSKAVEAAPSYPTQQYRGRGIVTCAGGSTYLLNAWVHLNRLRQTGCELPVELWYYGREEICEAFIVEFQKIKVHCRDLKELYPNLSRGYELKPFSIVASSFEEVLFLDADNHPLRDPSFLFELPEYQYSGALFWPDRMFIKKDNPIWKIIAVEPPPNLPLTAQESGQLLVHKKKAWLPLQVTLHMNKESDFYYKFLYGDKDTFLFSWKAVNKHFYMIPFYLGILRDPKPKHYLACLQRDHIGVPLFYHLTTRKRLSIQHGYRLQDIFELPENAYEFIPNRYLISPINACEHPNGYIAHKVNGSPLYSFVKDFPEAIPEGNKLLIQIMQNPAIRRWVTSSPL